MMMRSSPPNPPYYALPPLSSTSTGSLRIIAKVALVVAITSHTMSAITGPITGVQAFASVSSTMSSTSSRTSSRQIASSVMVFGSLRDLLESNNPNNNSNNNDNNDSNNENDPLNPRSDQDQDFNHNGPNFSRSKFADTKFRSRNEYHHNEGGGSRVDEERGLHLDRLSTFSFSSNAPRSWSEGGGLAEEEEEEEEEEQEAGKFEMMDDDEEEEVDEDEDEEEEDFSGSPSDVERILNSLGDYDDNGNDNYDNKHLNSHMVGVNYSRRKQFPNRTQGRTSDEEDQLGLHKDRLSTFSFSDNQPMLKKLSQQPSRVEVPQEAEEGIEEDDDDDGEDANNLPPSIARSNINDVDNGPSFGVDNFHNNINIDMSRTSRLAGLANRPNPNAILPEGQTNHMDRLSTFSLSDKDEKDGKPLPDVYLGGTGDGRSLPEEVSNHDDRLGTFSFGAATTKSNTSNNKANANAQQQQQQPPPPPKSTTTVQTNGQNKNEIPKGRKSSPSNEPHPTDPNKVYTFPQAKGSLASIASSVSVKSRNDRIEEVKTRTDPRLLHPDGMNTPRLNSKGDVMSASNFGGRPTIFQRIEQANIAGEGVGDVSGDVGGDVVGDDEGSSNNIAEKESTHDNDSIDDSLEDGDCFIGFDLGTSGARMSIVEKKSSSPSDRDDEDDASSKWNYEEVFASSLAWDDAALRYDDARAWRTAVDALLLRAGGAALSRVRAICVSGTSATCLLARGLEASRPARMYDYDISSGDDGAASDRVADLIDRYVPEKHTARANTGSLAKLLLWIEERALSTDDDDDEASAEVLCHQSDYISMSLMHEGLDDGEKCTVTSDWHNCLKLGYDVREREFPAWMRTLLEEGAGVPNADAILPAAVVSPGEPFGAISPAVASRYGLSSDVALVGGTTDSNAAFFAAAGARPEAGTAVTSLGSTLAMKMLSGTFVEDAGRGVYSHRFPRFGSSEDDDDDEDDGLWLVGGASNVGCAVLRQEGFTNEELAELSAEIDPNSDSPLSYYPLTKKGERFPIADSAKQPVLTPKPDDRKEYLHAILQGIGDVERDGFRILGELGASPADPTIVWSCGGGSKNDMWISMRERRLREGGHQGGVEVRRAKNTEASYGAALLAAASFED